MSRPKKPRFSSTLRRHPEIVFLRDYPEMVAYMKEHERLLLTHPWQGGTVNTARVEFRNTENENKVITRAGANGLLLQCPKCKAETCLPWGENIIQCYFAWVMTRGRTSIVRCTCPQKPVLVGMGIVEKQGLLPTDRLAALTEAKEALETFLRDANYAALENRLEEVIERLGEPVLWIK